MDYSSNTEIWLFISQVVNLILKLAFSMANISNTNDHKPNHKITEILTL